MFIKLEPEKPQNKSKMGIAKKRIRQLHFSLSRKLLANSNKFAEVRNINRLIILLLYILVSFIVIVVFTVQDFLSNDFRHIKLIDIPAYIILPGMFVFLLKSKKINLISHIFIVFVALIIIIVFFTGADKQTGPVFFVIFPPISIFLLGARQGLLYSVGLLIVLTAIYILYNNAPWFPGYDLQVFFRYIIIVFLVASSILLYENMIQRFQNSNVKLIARIKGQNESLSLKAAELKTANEKLLGANKELEKKTTEAESLNNSLTGLIATKDKFFSIISHDLKNPVNTLDGFACILNEKYDAYNDEKRKKYITIIQESSANLKNLIEGLLEWSRIQTGSIKFNAEKIYLYPLIDMVIDNIRLQAFNKNISINNGIDGEVSIFADFQMMYSIFRNLLSNAVKFTAHGGQVNFYATTENQLVNIYVEDNGIGISQENMIKLFRIDSSFSTTGTNNEAGTGLGLVLAQEFAQKNNGSISVQSTQGSGSVFCVSIPKT
ncbi:MAG: HAMP domain-containing histidine kinase [Bacteroidales bacterium]|nr:HAMP domain-containing histidine kinase [Bacteroidales bacterium]